MCGGSLTWTGAEGQVGNAGGGPLQLRQQHGRHAATPLGLALRLAQAPQVDGGLQVALGG